MDEYDRCNNKINKIPKDTENLSKELQSITHPFTLYRARKIPTQKTNR